MPIMYSIKGAGCSCKRDFLSAKLLLTRLLYVRWFLPVSAEVEVRIVVQVLRLNTLSKLTYSDSQRFDSLVHDVFPGVVFSDVEYETLEAALREASGDSNLVVIDRQVRATWWSLIGR